MAAPQNRKCTAVDYVLTVTITCQQPHSDVRGTITFTCMHEFVPPSTDSPSIMSERAESAEVSFANNNDTRAIGIIPVGSLDYYYNDPPRSSGLKTGVVVRRLKAGIRIA